MDCQTVRQMIDMLPPKEHDLPSVEELALREHLAACPLCLSAAEDVQEWDQRLQAVMTSVSIPDGFRERLLSQLAQTAPPLATSPLSLNRPRRLFRIASWTALSIALVLGAVFWMSQPPRLQLASLENGAVKELRNKPEAELPVFDQSFVADLGDTKWQKVCHARPVGLNIDQRTGHDLAAFRVNIPSLRFRGWLVLVPISRVVDIPMSTYPDTIHYAQTAAWHDSKFVYICLAEQGSLEALVAQWNSAAA